MKSLENIKCILCGEDNYKTLFPSTLKKSDFNPSIIQEDLKNTLGNYKKHSRIVRCINCNMVYTNPMENIARLLIGYKDVVDHEYLKTEKFRKILSLEHLEKISEHKKMARFLM